MGFDFSLGDIQELARKLDEVGPRLEDRERRILLAIFVAARDHVSVRAKGPEPAEPTGASLREQLLKAFLPMPAEDGYYFTESALATRIGSGPVIHG